MIANWHAHLHRRYFESDSTGRLALFTYGSLLIRRELMDVFSPRRVTVRPVRAAGLRRTFDVDIGRWLEDPPAGRTGVLNVCERDESWCNGLLVIDVGEAGFRNYAEREFGYRLTRLNVDRLERHPGGGSPGASGMDLYTCYVPKAHTDDQLMAYPPYRDRCLRGARSWGETFHGDFLASTFSGGRRLAELGDELRRS